jgi:two-component system cell cycle response regulator DivK
MANARILIVEDNPKNLKLIRDLLQFKGYQTIEADSAEAGIELAREQHPTLILMDIQLPGIDGRKAMKVLKADASTQQIPIIALTASAMKGDRERLLAEGFDGYIPKPIDIKAFPEQLESFLSERQ